MEALTIRHANAMPAPTWSWLKMNDTDIRIPDGLERRCQVQIEAGDDLLETNASFEGAVEALSEHLELAPRTAAADGRAVALAATGADDGAAELDIPALSTYERRAVLSELADNIGADFVGGVGTDARSYLTFLAGGAAVLASEPNAKAAASVRVEAAAGTASSACLDVVAAAGSTIELDLTIDADTDAAALAGSTMRVFAGERASVDITVYVCAGPQTTVIEDAGLVLAEDARVRVRHVVLAGQVSITGLAADLRGDRSRIDIDTRYVAAGSEQRDFNYVIRHRGRKTISNMDANGVLAGQARKCLRGTIELIHGAKGAEGNERETVLLASEGVGNKTVPTILCDEDDVAGNHGATIGHVRPEQLFYAACRGLSAEQTEALFMRSKFEDAWMSAPTDAARAAVARLARTRIPDFEEELA